MKFLGIPLRQPSSNEITAASVMGCGLWIACIGLLHVLNIDVPRIDAGALLLVVWWGCVSVYVGIRIGKGHRHLAANLAVSATLLTVYQGALAFAA